VEEAGLRKLRRRKEQGFIYHFVWQYGWQAGGVLYSSPRIPIAGILLFVPAAILVWNSVRNHMI
jgi:hypothetical protein